jgi:soluble lytic murein transglycosylase-like protein
MPFHHRLAVASTCAAAVAAAAAPAAGAEVTALSAAEEATERAVPLVAAHDRAVRSHVRLERRHAHLQGRRPERGLAREVRDWSIAHLREANREQRRANRALARRLERRRPAPAAVSTAGGATPGHLAAIAQCESGGDPSAVGGGGAYGGKYQFSQSTWQAYGGTGSPAGAPEAEQDAVASRLYAAEGSSPWPTCG